MINIIIYYLFKLFSLVNILIPRKVSVFLGKIFGLLMYCTLKKSRHIAQTNIKIAFPLLSKQKSKKLLIDTFKHSGIITTEFFRQKRINLKKISINIDDNTKKILSDKSGLILMAAHFGNWEIFLPIISLRRKISALVREQKNAGGDKFISERRKFKNVSLISNQSNLNKMLKPLLNNEILLILNDQKPKKTGTSLKFFDKSAVFPRGSGHFYLQTQSRIGFGFCILKPDLSYEFKIKLFVVEHQEKSKNDIIDEINVKYAKLLEDEIIRYPEQYCWFYKKWDKSIYR